MRAFALVAPVSADSSSAAADPPPARRRRTEEITGEIVSGGLAACALNAGVDQIMCVDTPCLTEDAPISLARDLLLDHVIGAVPVLDDHGRPSGIVTAGDLLRAAQEGGRTETVADVMTAMVFAMPVSASIAQAAALMAYEGVKVLVITDLGGRVAGTLGALDIARWCARGAGYLVDR